MLNTPVEREEMSASGSCQLYQHPDSRARPAGNQCPSGLYIELGRASMRTCWISAPLQESHADQTKDQSVLGLVNFLLYASPTKGENSTPHCSAESPAFKSERLSSSLIRPTVKAVTAGRLE
jgi:hypothetical protein